MVKPFPRAGVLSRTIHPCGNFVPLHEPPEPVPPPEPPGYTLLYAMPDEQHESGHWWILWAALWIGISFFLGVQVGLGAPVLDLMLVVMILLILIIVYAFVLIFSRLVWPDETNR